MPSKTKKKAVSVDELEKQIERLKGMKTAAEASEYRKLREAAKAGGVDLATATQAQLVDAMKTMGEPFRKGAAGAGAVGEGVPSAAERKGARNG